MLVAGLSVLVAGLPVVVAGMLADSVRLVRLGSTNVEGRGGTSKDFDADWPEERGALI